MRVLLIARYLQMVNHRKVSALAAQAGIDLWHIAPRQWKDGLRLHSQALRAGQGYHFLPTRTIPCYDTHRFVYWPPGLSLKRIRPDIIHLEEEPDSLAALETVVARRRWAPSARLILFTWQNIRRARSWPVERLARFVLRQADHVIAGNREAVGVLRMQGYTGPTSVLPQLGVDTDTFKPDASHAIREQLGLTGFVAGYVGRFIPQKGLDILVKAVAQVEGCLLLLVGGGPMQSEIEALADSLDLRDRLVMINAVPHQDVPRYMNAMDALVLPSRTTPHWKEQFGHVLIEAMACGTPAIGSNSGAIPEVIGSAGLIFPEGDVDALAQHLRRLATHRDESRRLGQDGLAHVHALYTHGTIAEQTARIYRSVHRSTDELNRSGVS